MEDVYTAPLANRGDTSKLRVSMMWLKSWASGFSMAAFL
jgi:hypothetical protein